MKKFIKQCKSMLCSMLVMICICGCGEDTVSYIHSEESDLSEGMETETQEPVSESQEVEEETENALLYVYVCGAVKSSGVYTLPSGSRVCDLFEEAGGLTEDAAVDYWNQASLLTDGQMIYVPTVEEAEERGEKDVSSHSSETENTNDTSGKINLNTASLEQLMQIPGIGEAKARAILNYRETNGGFSSIEEVMNIEGIKEGVFAKMKEYIVVD